MPMDRTIFEKDIRKNKNVGARVTEENLYRQARGQFPGKRHFSDQKH